MAHDSLAIGRRALLATLVLGAAGGPVRAQETPEQREACMHDTKRLCENAMPDVGRAVECLKANRARLNHRCRAALDKPPPAAPSPQTAPTTPSAPPSAPAPAAAPKPQAASDQPTRPTPSSSAETAPRRRPHLAFAPHWRYTLRKPKVPLVRHHTLTPAQRVLAMQRAMARRCRAAGSAYNAYSGTCGTNYFGGFFQ